MVGIIDSDLPPKYNWFVLLECSERERKIIDRALLAV